MADIALRSMQVGIESTYGTGVAATREWYGEGKIQSSSSPAVMVNEDRGSYDAHHRATENVLEYEWEFAGGLDLDDVVEMLQMAMDDGPAVTGAGPYVWTFTPSPALKSGTIEWDSSGQVWDLDGAMVDTFGLSGTANGEDVTVELAGPGQTRATSSLTSLSDHVTNVVQGWELKLYMDALGATPGTTELTATIISWDIEITNSLTRKYKGDNSRYINGVSRGRRMLTGNILCCLNASALTLLTNAEAVTEKLIRLELGNNVSAGGGNYHMYIDVPCVLSANEIGEDEEETTVSFEFTSIYDATNTFAYEVTVQNSRAS